MGDQSGGLGEDAAVASFSSLSSLRFLLREHKLGDERDSSFYEDEKINIEMTYSVLKYVAGEKDNMQEMEVHRRAMQLKEDDAVYRGKLEDAEYRGRLEDTTISQNPWAPASTCKSISETSSDSFSFQLRPLLFC